jgi:twitching motility protein PilT
MPQIDQLCDKMLNKNASDLHLIQGQKPKFRIQNRFETTDDESILDENQITQLMHEICESRIWEKFQKQKDVNFTYSLENRGRFRVNYFQHSQGIGAVLQVIPVKIGSFQDLNLPPVLTNFAKLQSGLVLVTGPSRSGKSTTLAAMIDYINTHNSRYIVTVEAPIEYIHSNKNSVISQFEVGTDTPDIADGLKIALQKNADVILVDEMKDPETFSLALTAASMGSLVFGSLYTCSAHKTIDYIIGVFSADEQNRIRTLLADTLRGICTQILLKTRNGQLLPAHEILQATQGLSANIRENNINNIQNIIMAGKSNGMQLMDDVLEQFLNEGKIAGETAYAESSDKKRFDRFADR